MLRGLGTGLTLVSLSAVIHTIGLVLVADWLIKRRPTAEREFNIKRYTLQLTSVFAVIVLLHLVETLVWAAFYDLWSLFGDFETSWYFSLGSYTTIGYGDVVLPARWRMLGGLEGITGVLLCGLSTAFLFAIVNEMFASRARHRSWRSG
ncbi:MAG TPA: potassium channel family protein [Blastocatellia bacterium]|nr:potassium channel family protein [Blastocatellia bacterium]